MSLWKKFIFVFTAQTLGRVFIFAVSTWGLVYGIQSKDNALLFFGIGLAVVGYLWVTLSFLNTFLLTDYYIVEKDPASELNEIFKDIQCLERITKLRDCIATDAAEDVYFEDIKSKLKQVIDSL